jgi:hypothetical protein
MPRWCPKRHAAWYCDACEEAGCGVAGCDGNAFELTDPNAVSDSITVCRQCGHANQTPLSWRVLQSLGGMDAALTKFTAHEVAKSTKRDLFPAWSTEEDAFLREPPLDRGDNRAFVAKFETVISRQRSFCDMTPSTISALGDALKADGASRSDLGPNVRRWICEHCREVGLLSGYLSCLICDYYGWKTVHEDLPPYSEQLERLFLGDDDLAS